MDVFLAGFNLDTDMLADISDGKMNAGQATPETISAAYARISRNPKPVNELRKIARQEMEKSRASNRNIIFDMGHHSVAEHAVFNFDIIGVSRLAIEAIEHFRLCSYTEKSQRYIKLKGNFVVPQEITDLALAQQFVKTVENQNRLYAGLMKQFKQDLKDKSNGSISVSEMKKKEMEGKEDIRYITSLATEGQLGMTANARNLELMIRRFAAHPLSEVRELGEKLYKLVLPIAPSIILFPEPTEFDSKTRPELTGYMDRIFDNKSDGRSGEEDDRVHLVYHTPDADEQVLAALLHSNSHEPFGKCLFKVKQMSGALKRELIKQSVRYMQFYDSVLREFEHVHAMFEITVSASCFAQMKRHRMATITTQNYHPSLGITIPRNIFKLGADKEFMRLVKDAEVMYYKIAGSNPEAAVYALTNAHRRRLLIQMNARELYHFARLREDKHAQWEIRELAHQMIDKTKKVMPLTLLLACGKDMYAGIYKEIFGFQPAVLPPEE